MFDPDDIIIVLPQFRVAVENQEDLDALVNYLCELYGFGAEAIFVEQDESWLEMRFEIGIQRCLKSQKVFKAKMDDIARRFNAVFLGWKHTSRIERNH